jgi:SAM-dependent methyltransferase
MGLGKRYPFIENILRENIKIRDSRVLEIGAGGAVYRDMFPDYIGTDLAGNPYAKPGDLDVYCDAQKIPFKAGSFDIAFVVAALYQIPDAEGVLDEIRRVLKPDGVFLIFDYNKGMTKRLKQAEREADNQNHVWSANDLRMLAFKHGYKAEILNHFLYFPPSSSLLKERIKRARIYHWANDRMREGWNVILARK